MFREGLARSFEREVGFRLVAQCATSSEALAFLAATREPVTVLLDVDLGKHRGLEFVEAARRAGFKSPILVLTAGISGQEAVQLMQAGVAGIMHKHRSTRALCEANSKGRHNRRSLARRRIRNRIVAIRQSDAVDHASGTQRAGSHYCALYPRRLDEPGDWQARASLRRRGKGFASHVVREIRRSYTGPTRKGCAGAIQASAITPIAPLLPGCLLD